MNDSMSNKIPDQNKAIKTETKSEGEDRFRALADQAPMMVFIADTNAKVTYWSKYWLDYTGLTHEEALGRAWDKIVHPDDFQNLLDHYLEATTSKKNYSVEARMKRKDGAYRYFLFTGGPRYLSEGEFAGNIGTGIDIHDRKEAEKALNKSEQRFRTLVEETILGTAVFSGKNMVLEMANSVALQRWGKDHSVIGKPLLEFFPELKGFYYDILEKVYTTGETYTAEEVETKIKRKDNYYETLYMDICYKALRDEQGEVEGVLAMGMNVTEKVVNRKKQEESSAQLAFAIEATELGTFDYNPTTNKFSSNDRLKEWFGLLPEEEIVLDQAINSIVERDRQRVMHAIQQALDYAGGGHYNIEYTIVNPVSKKETIVRAKGKAYFNEEKMAYRFNGTLQDITDQYKTEKERQKLISIIEASEDFVGLAAPDTLVQYVNPAGLKKLGWDNYEGKNIFDCVYSEDMKLARQFVPILIQKGFFSHEIRFVNAKTGEPFWMQWNGFAIKDHFTDQIIGLATISSDITERKKADEELAKITKRYQLALDAGKLGSYELTVKTGLIECSEQCKYNFGFGKNDEITYPRLLESIFPEDRKGMEESVANAFKNNTIYNIDYRVYWPDGSMHWIHASGIPIYGKEGEPVKMTGVTLDITKQKLFEQELGKQVREHTKQLKQQNIDLEKMNKELESFAYVSSHDLQEPLRKIQTFAARILEIDHKNLSETGKDYFKRMHGAAKRMKALIEDLLAYSRTNTTDQPFENTDFNLLVSEILEDLKDLILEKQATIEVGKLCHVKVIPFQFHQLFQNLINNSLKFSSPERKPIIKITSTVVDELNFQHPKILNKGKYCHITVSDNGIGFDQKYNEKIFEIFQRLHTNSEYEGTGIGLAIVNKIVENHKGFFIATGKANQGATFDIYIPV